MAVQIIPQEKGKTELFGDLFGSIMGGYTQGKLLKKKQAQDDAMRIWQMAQYDPFMLSSPQAQKTFKGAGYPMPTPGRPYRERKIIKGKDVYYMVDPYTGQITRTNIPAPVSIDPFSTLFGSSPELQGLIQEEGMGGIMPQAPTGMAPTGMGQMPAPTVPTEDISDIINRLQSQTPMTTEEPFVGPSLPPKPGISSRILEALNKRTAGTRAGYSPLAGFPPLSKGMGVKKAKTKTEFTGPPAPPKPTTTATRGKYKKGDIIERGGNRYKVVGFDTDGEPLVEKI